MDLESRYTGCLLGLAVGDALGAPLHHMRPEQIHIKHGTVREMIGGGWLLLRPGEYTDDTTMALLLARSLVETGGLDEADVARRYSEWFRTAPKEPSGVLRTALSLLSEGAPVEQAARSAHELSAEDAAGNETVMRCAPLALFFASDRVRLMEAAAREARITHWDARAAAGSAALCVLLSLVLEGAERDGVFDTAFDILEENALGLANVLTDVPEKDPADLRPRPFVVDTLEVAVYHFLKAPSFEETIVRTANMGGESDTTSSVAGALAGAYWGVEAIPKRWLRALTDRTVIRGLARELLRIRLASGQD
ncbi:MAG: ADP-ribosylglycohydrolase family protein [Planctomycetota bacterium]|jgi:ADP-ribosyl-[dinitrogen reductase] hydrolase